ncbi:MAG: type II toxin-antitoxin system VapB family antitoxin [Halothiobacillaceae bacterium]
MRTTMTLDDGIIEELMQVTGENSHAAAIRHALQSFLQHSAHQQHAASELRDMLHHASASGESHLTLNDIRAQVQATHRAA